MGGMGAGGYSASSGASSGDASGGTIHGSNFGTGYFGRGTDWEKLTLPVTVIGLVALVWMLTKRK